jgi:hypothetical protein
MWWHMPVILPTWNVDGKIMVRGQPGLKLVRLFLKISQVWWYIRNPGGGGRRIAV